MPQAGRSQVLSKKSPTDWTGKEVVPGRMGLINHGYALLNKKALSLAWYLNKYCFSVVFQRSSPEQADILDFLCEIGGPVPGVEQQESRIPSSNFGVSP